MPIEYLPASYKDPNGFIFKKEDEIYRQVNYCYKDNYELLMNSGLYNSLIESDYLVPHNEVNTSIGVGAYKVIKPIKLPFISYPYEWSISQLKDAALLTLKIQKRALEYGMTLKDGTAYNVQFLNGKPVFIDTLSFEKYIEGKPWIAYRQFCQHFFAPLVLMSNKDIRLNQLLRIYMDGIPLNLANKLLGIKSYSSFSVFTHLNLHSKSQEYFSDKKLKSSYNNFKLNSLLGLIDSLSSAIDSIEWRPKGTVWGQYYENTNYSDESFELKKSIVKNFLEELNTKYVWDLGSNTGVFSRIAYKCKALTISIDNDPAAVELNYRECVKNKETMILPLIIDLTNPSPNNGWANEERMSLINRGPADTVLALALVHHLVISNNLPFAKIASFFWQICSNLIIEFIPKEDSQVQKLLQNREDIFFDYTRQNFEREFGLLFNIKRIELIKYSKRILYVMVKKSCVKK